MTRPVCAPLLAVGLLAAAFCPTPARADLVVRGPIREHEALFRSLYARLPERGKKVDVTVQEVSPAEWTKVSGADDPDAVGVYDDQTREIFLKQGEPDLEWTFVHEFGHHVFFAAMGNAERRDWRRYWTQHQAQMPEGDAQDDPDEGWAECYAGVYCPKKLGWRLAVSIQDKTRTYFTRAAVASASHAQGVDPAEADRQKRRRNP
jgi:hypothetical protein